MRSRTRRTTFVLALVTVLTFPGAQAALADPVDDDDVAAAAASVDDATAAVAHIEFELALQQSSLDAAWQQVGLAGEAYNQAQIDAAAALAASQEAARRSDAADADLDVARDELAEIALEAYRSGGELNELGALLSADGFDDFVARSAAIEGLGDRADRAVQRLEAAELVADTLLEHAATAATEATAARSAAAEALAAAQEAEDRARRAVAETESERESLLAQLAAARATSVEVERARQAQLDTERQQRREAAARASRTEPRTSGGSASGASSGSSGSNSNAGSGGTTSPPPAASAPPPATPTPPPAPATDPYGPGTGTQRGSSAQASAAVQWGLAQVGKTYSYGASGPAAFDCSGLTMRSWQAAGLSINRTSRDQYRASLKISYSSMRPGDLIFWGSDPSNPSSVYHVAMYVGGGQMVEAPRPGLTVRVVPVRYSNSMPYAGRP